MATDTHIDDHPQVAGQQRRHAYPFWWGRAMWTVNLVALACLAIWILADARFPATACHVKPAFESLRGDFQQPPTGGSALGQRPKLLIALIVTAVFTLPAIFVTLFAGSQQHRSLRTWFAFTLLVAAWLTLFVAWPEVTWQGQRVRVWTRLDGFQTIATALQNNWPQGDGELPEVGTFMAYPQGNPRTLMILVEPQPPTDPRFSAVERSDDGTLRFELAGDETGSWLELHPSGSMPESFTGGLENTYSRGRSAPLGNGWYLVRYR